MTENSVEKLMSASDAPVDSERALARIRARIEREHLRAAPVATPRRSRESGPLVSIWVKGLAAAASVVLIATLLTVSGVAETILTIFEPKQVAAVPITSTDIATAMNGLGTYGTLTWSIPPKPYDVPDAATAAKDSGLTILTPRELPAGVSPARYGVMPRTTATFTFSADQTRQAASRLNRTPPPMPANIDGSTLFITGGPGLVQYYADSTAPTSTAGNTSPFGGMPKLIVAQGKGPVVQSDGVTVEQLQQYLLAQPGITPALAAQIKAIKDPSSTLPIPIPVDTATSKTVTVQGVQGVFIGDSTGLGSAVIWSKDGLVFGVAGTLSEAEILKVANSLR
jgi:hypothetical protein